MLMFVKDLRVIEDMEKLYEKRGIEAMTDSDKAENTMGEMSNRPDTSSGDETIHQTRENGKRKECEGSSSELLDDGENESNVPKKKRFIWTNEMHRKFVDAIAQIGEDRAFPKRIVEVMNEPGLTRENVASHLQKYRICLKKSQEERERYFQGFNAATENSKTPYMYNYSLGNYQQLGTSQVASNNYLPTSTSIYSSLYRIRTGIGASSVRLAPPSYSCLDVSSLPGVNTGNTHSQYSRRTEGNTSFRDYGGEVSSTFKRRPCSRSSDDYATSSSTSNIAFTGLQFANDGRSILFGGATRSDIISTGSHSSKRNGFHYQESEAPMFPTLNIESNAQNSPLPPPPDFEDHLEEPSLPPLPEFYAKNSLVGLETEENKFTNFIPRQETNFGTTLTEGINSFSSGHTGTSLDQQNSLEVLASEILENIEKEQIFNHTVTSLPPSTTPWSTNTNMASNPLINQEEYSLPPLPSEVPWDLSPDLVPPFMDQENSPLPPLPSSFHDNLW